MARAMSCHHRDLDPPQAYLPGFEPPRPAVRSNPAPTRLPSLDDPTLTAIEELVAETAPYADYIRAYDGPRIGPIDLADIIAIRTHVKRRLHVLRLPFPSDDYLDDLLIELVGWFYEFELADDVPPPQILSMPDDGGDHGEKT